MRKTKKRPHIVDAATASGVLEMFQEANKTLEKIQKSLEDYLETKRNGFPLVARLVITPLTDKCFMTLTGVITTRSGSGVMAQWMLFGSSL